MYHSCMCVEMIAVSWYDKNISKTTDFTTIDDGNPPHFWRTFDYD